MLLGLILTYASCAGLIANVLAIMASDAIKAARRRVGR